jgi:hypothetical protein
MKTVSIRGKVCPYCASQDTRRSRRNLLEFLLMAFLMWPYRCRVCGIRFWRFV